MLIHFANYCTIITQKELYHENLGDFYWREPVQPIPGRARPRMMSDSWEGRFPKQACSSLFTLLWNQQSPWFIIRTSRFSLLITHSSLKCLASCLSLHYLGWADWQQMWHVLTKTKPTSATPLGDNCLTIQALPWKPASFPACCARQIWSIW